MYHFIERLHTLYGLLHDEESRDVFKASLSLDMESRLNAGRLLAESRPVLPLLGWPQPWMAELKQLTRSKKRSFYMEHPRLANVLPIYWNLRTSAFMDFAGGIQKGSPMAYLENLYSVPTNWLHIGMNIMLCLR